MRGQMSCSRTPERNVIERWAIGRTSKLRKDRRKTALTLIVTSLPLLCLQMRLAPKTRGGNFRFQAYGSRGRILVRLSEANTALAWWTARRGFLGTWQSTCSRKPYSQGGLRSGSAYVIRIIGQCSLGFRQHLWLYCDHLKIGELPRDKSSCLPAKAMKFMSRLGIT